MRLDQIRADPDFDNLRLPPSPSELEKLAASMKAEGLHVPIILIESPEGDGYFLRAGFRRTAAARLLKWEEIPAIILPLDTPVVAEYWTNLIENSARDKLTSYEIAHAAQTMRDKFGVKASEFATKAGYSESYVVELLRCIDRLPPKIVEIWKDKAPIPVALYYKWTNLDPESAIKQMLVYCGRHPKIVEGWTPPQGLRKSLPIKMASEAGLRRMQRLRFAVEVARALDEPTRKLCLQVIDFCTGARDSVPGVYDNSVKQRVYKSRRREDLEPAEPDPELLADVASSDLDLPSSLQILYPDAKSKTGL